MSKLTEKLGWLVLIAILFLIGLAVTLFAGIARGWDIEKLGQRGDFFGGFANPLLTFFTFIGVLLTIALQKEELSETRREMARQGDALETQLIALGKQSFESALFQMLHLLNDITTSAVWSGVSGRDMVGRRAMKVVCDGMRDTMANQTYEHSKQSIGDIYREAYYTNRDILGHYFRTLYNVIRFVDEKCPADKMTYIRVVRAQLSDYELLLLFYNVVYGKGEKFRDYILKFDLLDNLDEEMLLDEGDAKELERVRPADGKDPTAAPQDT